MVTRFLALAALLLATAGSGHAQDFGPGAAETLRSVEGCLARAGDNPRSCIRQAANSCMDLPGGDTTSNSAACLASEHEASDTILNRNYQAALRSAETADGELTEASERDVASTLKAAQRAWIGYRDAECDRIYAYWKGGTIRTVAALGCQLDLTAERALALAEQEG